MTEIELEKLKVLTTPPPQADAKARALSAAMAVFSGEPARTAVPAATLVTVSTRKHVPIFRRSRAIALAAAATVAVAAIGLGKVGFELSPKFARQQEMAAADSGAAPRQIAEAQIQKVEQSRRGSTAEPAVPGSPPPIPAPVGVVRVEPPLVGAGPSAPAAQSAPAAPAPSKPSAASASRVAEAKPPAPVQPPAALRQPASPARKKASVDTGPAAPGLAANTEPAAWTSFCADVEAGSADRICGARLAPADAIDARLWHAEIVGKLPGSPSIVVVGIDPGALEPSSVPLVSLGNHRLETTASPIPGYAGSAASFQFALPDGFHAASVDGANLQIDLGPKVGSIVVPLDGLAAALSRQK